MLCPPARLFFHAGAIVCIGLATAGLPQQGAAQCVVLNPPAAFDPPAGVTPPPGFASRASSMTVFGVGTSRKLAVRWNYGFAVYSLANPAAPAFQYIQNLKDSGYPKNGDGSERTGAVGASGDGQRFLVPWTDAFGYGTITMVPAEGKFAASGDYLPNVSLGQDSRVAALKIGARYIGFTLAANTLTVADLTNLPNVTGAGTPGSIPSETVQGVSGMLFDLVAFQGGGKSWVVINGYNKIYLGDVTNPGASVPGLSSGFVWKTLNLADFTPAGSAAWSGFKNVAAAVHPTENVPYIMAEGLGNPSPGLSLVKVDSTLTTVTPVGSYIPPAPYTYQTTASALIPLDTEVLGMFLSKSAADATKLTALASSDFTRDRSPNAILGVVSGTGLLRAVRGAGSAVAIYSGSQSGAWAAGLDCTFPDEPAATYFLLEKVPPVGSAVALTSGESVFIGDAVRIYPRVTPPASSQPLTDWRFDYDYHAGSAVEANPLYPRVKQPDLCKSCAGGAPTPPASIDLVGPCDPRNTTPTAPNPATGAGCWVSVTTNGLQGGPDFASATAPVAATLSFGLEAQNALNGVDGAPTSGLTTFNLVWNVPQPRVLSSSIFWGDALQDGSDGSPDTSSAAWEWYFAPTAGAANLVRDLTCTSSTCAHVFPGKGSFGYFLRVPYRGGYITPDCSKANGACTNALGTIVVTDVSLVLTAPSSVYRTEAVIPVSSQSRKAAAVTGSFTYEICPSPCSTTPVSGTATLTGDPFATSGGGYVNVPMPTTAGTYDLRLTYSYVGPADCASAPCKVYWPSQTGWSQVLVSNAMPDIRLLSTTGTSLCFGSSCDIYTGNTGYAYTYVNGVPDPAPPAGMRWLWGDGGSSGTGPAAQGAPFSYSTAGTYTITLQGYGADYHKTIYVTDMPVHDPPTVSAVTFSRTKPAVGEYVVVSCLASPGTYAIESYHISFGDGQSYTGAASSVSHAWASEGTKSVGCTVVDVYDLASATRYGLIDVGGPDVGPTVTAIDVAPELLLPGTSATLTCSATAPAGRLVAGYEFDFGDSSPLVNGPSSSASHAYQAAGSYPATCRAYDASGRSGSLQRTVVVHEPFYSLQVAKIGSGGGLVYSTASGLSCGSICSAVIATGTSVVLDTIAEAGSRFAGWSGSGCAGIGPCTVFVTAATRVTANFLPEIGTRFAPVTPCRVADTRTGTGIPLAAGEVRTFPVTGSGCGVPSAAQVAAMNVTVTQPSAAGFVTVFPSGLETPGTLTVAFSPGRTRAAPTIVQIGPGGFVSVYNSSSGTVHVILDVSGVFQ